MVCFRGSFLGFLASYEIQPSVSLEDKDDVSDPYLKARPPSIPAIHTEKAKPEDSVLADDEFQLLSRELHREKGVFSRYSFPCRSRDPQQRELIVMLFKAYKAGVSGEGHCCKNACS